MSTGNSLSRRLKHGVAAASSKMLARSRPSTRSADAAGSGWIERLDRTAPEDRRELVSSLVAGETRHVLGLNAEEQLDPDRGLFELGMDSLMSVQLKGRLEKSIGCALPATLTFTYPTVNALTDFLLCQVLKLSTTSAVDVASRNESNEAATAGRESRGLKRRRD